MFRFGVSVFHFAASWFSNVQFRLRSSGSVIQDLSESWCFKGTGESTLVMDSPVPLTHHDPDRSWITGPDPNHPKGTQRMEFSDSEWNLATASGI